MLVGNAMCAWEASVWLTWKQEIPNKTDFQRSFLPVPGRAPGRAVDNTGPTGPINHDYHPGWESYKLKTNTGVA